MFSFTSYGAVQTVTGSSHYVTLGETHILIDCGMYQGNEGMHNYDPFPFDPARLDYLILTHAHIDHIGRLPKLLKEGFVGTIIATQATFEIAPVMLYDSANLLAEEYATCLRKAVRSGEEQNVCAPLFTKEDVALLSSASKCKLPYNTPFSLDADTHVTLYDAGHIMGSAFVHLRFVEDEEERSILFSGDLGGHERLILDAPALPPKANTLVLESTYGDRVHRPLDQSVEELKSVINDTLSRGGNVVIPSFALERTQELLWILHQMSYAGELEKCRVFLDSPLAQKATRFYARYPLHLSQLLESRALEEGVFPFSFRELEGSPSKKSSIKINDIQKRAIIITGGGMCNGGRILHHLKHRLWDGKNAIIFVGFQAEGTLGRTIVEGAEFVHIYGEKVKINASIHTIGGFSAHAGQDDLTTFAQNIEGLEHIYLVHGEKAKMDIFKSHLQSTTNASVHIVAQGEQYIL